MMTLTCKGKEDRRIDRRKEKAHLNVWEVQKKWRKFIKRKKSPPLKGVVFEKLGGQTLPIIYISFYKPCPHIFATKQLHIMYRSQKKWHQRHTCNIKGTRIKLQNYEHILISTIQHPRRSGNAHVKKIFWPLQIYCTTVSKFKHGSSRSGQNVLQKDIAAVDYLIMKDLWAANIKLRTYVKALNILRDYGESHSKKVISPQKIKFWRSDGNELKSF